MSENVELLHGWYSLHDFRKFDRREYLNASSGKQDEFKSSLLKFWEKKESEQAKGFGSFAVYEIVGHKADLLFLNLSPSAGDLIETKNTMASWPLSNVLVPTFSYFGVVELSNYVVSQEQQAAALQMIEKRLKPTPPSRKHVCFYPMSKKREGLDNWYSLPLDERKRMMRSHGRMARSHSDVIMQMISGSIGLDDHEWGVTLFAEDLLSFKKVVTDLRFDEVSARFAIFGDFLVGNRIEKEGFIKWFELGEGK